MKDLNPTKKFITTTNYEGYCRREIPRYGCLVPATLTFNEKESIVKVLNIGHGGCKIAMSNSLNTQGTVSLTFFRPCDENDYKECVPIHGRVIHVHKKKNLYIINIDFKGILFDEHGIESIIKNELDKQKNN